MNFRSAGLWFVIAGLLCLIAGILMGNLAALQFIIPGVFDALPFFKSRPLHVSLVVSWIFLCAVGGIYHYLPNNLQLPLHAPKMAFLHFWIYLTTGMAIIGSYLAGRFGGREYWEFPPYLAIPIIISWIIFGYNYFFTTIKKQKWPVYLWMWGSGIFFFLFTYLEAHLWIFSWFSANVVREITVQWKAYGALVGSWNMLVYGTSIFLMEKISGEPAVSRSKMAFSLYFLGLANLLFGWAHHTYPVPSAPWIRHFAYAISMTELFILGRIIWQWKSSLTAARKYRHHVSYYFLMASECWIFLNLIVALIMSVPALNIFLHGTHVTVAHAMGSTIGINTMILLASVFFMLQEASPASLLTPLLRTGFWITNTALLIFWTSLLVAGYFKGILIQENNLDFQQIMREIRPYLIGFTFAGIILSTGISIIAGIALRHFYLKKKPS